MPTSLRLISTGDDSHRLDRMEEGFARLFPPEWDVETIRLGTVASLRVAYHNAARLVGDPDTLLLFVHQDVAPITSEDLSTLPPEIALPLRRWLGEAGQAPWVELLVELCKDEAFGFAGVAGSCQLDLGRAWWQHERLTGMVFHRRVEGLRVNAFGPWSRALVLDGLCLIARAGTLQALPANREDLQRFHFYDMDLCLQAHQSGLRNWTLPLLLVHDSGGASSKDPRWLGDLDSFTSRHGSALPLQVPADPTPGLDRYSITATRS